MATLTVNALNKVGDNYSSTTAGQAAGFVAAAGGGDKIPLQGQYVLLTFRTAGTASTVTMDSVAPSNYGSDTNVTVVLGATDEQDVLIEVGDRFAGVGADAGLLNLTYTSVVALTVKAKYIA